MQNLQNCNSKPFTGRLSRIGRILLTVLFLISVFGSSASAQSTTPNEPAAPAETGAVLPGSPFGIQMWPMNSSGGGSYFQGSYTRWVRGPEIIWKDIEKTKGTYDWTAINKAVQDIQYAASINSGSTSVIVVVRGTPSWARESATALFSCGPIKSSEYQAFGLFMFNLITELANRGITYVKYWELWNEPDIQPIDSVNDPDQPWGGCWGDTSDAYFGGQKYGEMLKVVYPLIKTKDPNAQVMVGGLNLDCDPRFPPPAGKTDCNSSKFLEGILVASAGNSFDGVAFHAYDYVHKDGSGAYLIGQYSNSNWPGSAWNQQGQSLIQKARFIKSLLAKYNVTGKFLMNTENSLLDAANSTITNPYPSILETTKSYYVAQAYAAASAEGLRANIWFDVTGSWLRNNGLIKQDASDLLDAYTAYLFASSSSSNSCIAASFTYFNQISYPGVTGYEFGVIPPATQAPGCPQPPAPNPYHVWLLWSKDGALHTISLPSVSPIVYDVKGAPLVSNVQTITITPQPYYIIQSPFLVRSRLPVINRDLLNGNFEAGWNNWTTLNAGLPFSLQTSNPVDPRDPTQATKDTNVPLQSTSALLGNASLGLGQSKGVCSYTNVPLGYAEVKRTIAVPTVVGKNIYLKFNYIIYSQDTYGNTLDQFEVWINGTRKWVDGNKAFVAADACRWYRVPSTENERHGVTSGWATESIDITGYTGQTIEVSFRNYNRVDGWYNTYTYLDAVQVYTVTP